MNKSIRMTEPILNFTKKDSGNILNSLGAIDNSIENVLSPFESVVLDTSKIGNSGKVSEVEIMFDNALIAQIKLLASNTSGLGLEILDKELNLGFNELPEVVVPNIVLVH